ncbi:MAG: hypothetical protein JO272_13930 [Pseudonocardiales bacterium]|nr:hypothetical protein [Pseudonocardiales bacterium]
MTVLLLARDLNPSDDRLVRALTEWGVPVFRTDLAAFPQTLSLDVLWVNHPGRESDAVKPRQLDVARRCGLSVPDSQVTNRPDGVRGFARGRGGALVCKTLGGALRAESGRLQMAYTRRLDMAELDDLAGVDTTLHFFQPFVSKSFEARVTVVGDRIFAAAIRAKSDSARVDWARVDWRADYDALDYSIIEPPESVTTGMLAFLRVFGLSFGAFDFAITPSGDWVMFECNRPASTGG